MNLSEVSFFTPLDLLGWKGIDDNLREAFLMNPKLILLFPHSSNFDLIMAGLYLSYDPEVHSVRKYIRTVIDVKNLNNPLVSATSIYLNPIAVDKKCKGATDKICKRLLEDKRFMLMISPKGRMVNSEWKTGWYHIAKELDAAVIVAGPDFEKHKMVCPYPALRISDMTLEEATDIMKERMKDIAPHIPENENCKKNVSTSITSDSFRTGASVIFLLGFLTVMGSMASSLKGRYLQYDSEHLLTG